MKNSIEISGRKYNTLFIAGPCAVQSKGNNILEVAREVKSAGADALRGGIFKFRKDPKTFQGLGEQGLKLIAQAHDETGLPVVSEIGSEKQIDLFIKYDIDVYQIGARNAANSFLLRELGKKIPDDKAVIFKRGWSATKKETIGAIEYILEGGINPERIIFCERGIRTFANGEYDRFTMDIDFIADIAKDESFPYFIIADPSHAAGRGDIIENISLACIAAGAQGLIIETMAENTDRKDILCDANQAIKTSQLKTIIEKSKKIMHIIS